MTLKPYHHAIVDISSIFALHSEKAFIKLFNTVGGLDKLVEIALALKGPFMSFFRIEDKFNAIANYRDTTRDLSALTEKEINMFIMLVDGLQVLPIYQGCKVYDVTYQLGVGNQTAQCNLWVAYTYQ